MQGGAWEQLKGSPEKAYCIAIDPADPNLIAVGERDGDAADPHLDKCGLWESRDAGNTWNYDIPRTWDNLIPKLLAYFKGNKITGAPQDGGQLA